MAKTDLTAQRLRELLHYDPETGVFTRAVRAGHAAAGSLAGCLDCHGYIRIKVAGDYFRAHRLAWLYVHGAWPAGFIDHVNGVRNDNRMLNIRCGTNAQNLQNLKSSRRGKNGGYPLGVYKQKNRFKAVIQRNGKSLFVGSFLTPEAAHAAYVAEKRRLHEFGTL